MSRINTQLKAYRELKKLLVPMINGERFTISIGTSLWHRENGTSYNLYNACIILNLNNETSRQNCWVSGEQSTYLKAVRAVLASLRKEYTAS